MAKSKQGGQSGSWKKERASVNSKKSPRPRSNKGSGADKGKGPAAGSTSQYWRAGYTRKDGTEVKGHYVRNPNQQ